jgi:hypothetical protein
MLSHTYKHIHTHELLPRQVATHAQDISEEKKPDLFRNQAGELVHKSKDRWD